MEKLSRAMQSGRNSSSSEPARKTQAEQLHQSVSNTTSHRVRNNQHTYITMDLLRLQRAKFYAQSMTSDIRHQDYHPHRTLRSIAHIALLSSFKHPTYRVKPITMPLHSRDSTEHIPFQDSTYQIQPTTTLLYHRHSVDHIICEDRLSGPQ
jgi:hypothetical protein